MNKFNKIEILQDSEVIGNFYRLSLCFDLNTSIENIINSEEVYVAFHLYTGGLRLTTNFDNFTIKFTFNKKDYYINKVLFDSSEKQDYPGNLKVVSYKLIEGGGMLVNPKDFPIEFIKNGVTIDD